ncbi:discoidin domain-containing protein [Paraflavitalea sp. CAU 1676]|uniref:discoidin domain-containing protein n=1 Tax=Paraflavitalea sp. CAU 1676 TaxID=3032598 RepID=UPI0023D9B333|nr:discoidin domain-containing protein [Paraflavitalea sp. CAU 1676]MDF2188178.1 discoidin domain-containing protein [Paraflavitalea sp. CAU 1676]
MKIKFPVSTLLVATALCGALPSQAQLGSGWVSYSPTKKIHLDNESGLQTFNWSAYQSVCSPACADYTYTSSDDTEQFRLFDNRTNRAEIRLQNEYSTGSRQFEGYVTIYAPLEDESLMQIFGSSSGATQMMIRGYAADGGSLRGAGQTLATGIYGVELRINVIHLQEDVGNKIIIYVNGIKKAEIADNEAVTNYHKYGNYGTLTTDEAVVKWRKARFFRDGDAPSTGTVTNLALNRPVTATSQPQPENPASSAVDGNTGTRWSATGYPQSLEVDLGAVYVLDHSELVCYLDRAYQYTIQTKTTSGGTYSQVVNRSSNTTPGSVAAPITDQLGGVSARYVKINVTGASGYTGPWASLSEFRVFGSNTALNASGSTTLLAAATTDEAAKDAATELVVSPNPVSGGLATIRYVVNKTGRIRLAVYNASGQPTLLQDEHKTPGTYVATWNTAGKAAGLYIVQLTGADQRSTARLLVK